MQLLNSLIDYNLFNNTIDYYEPMANKINIIIRKKATQSRTSMVLTCSILIPNSFNIRKGNKE